MKVIETQEELDKAIQFAPENSVVIFTIGEGTQDDVDDFCRQLSPHWEKISKEKNLDAVVITDKIKVTVIPNAKLT